MCTLLAGADFASLRGRRPPRRSTQPCAFAAQRLRQQRQRRASRTTTSSSTSWGQARVRSHCIDQPFRLNGAASDRGHGDSPLRAGQISARPVSATTAPAIRNQRCGRAVAQREARVSHVANAEVGAPCARSLGRIGHERQRRAAKPTPSRLARLMQLLTPRRQRASGWTPATPVTGSAPKHQVAVKKPAPCDHRSSTSAASEKSGLRICMAAGVAAIEFITP